MSVLLPTTPTLREKGGVSGQDARQSAAPLGDWAQTRPPPRTRLSSLGSVGILEFRVCVLGVWGVDDALPRKPIMLKQADGRLGESRFANFQLHVGCRKPEDGSRPWWFSAASLFFGLVLGPRCFRVSATPGRGNGPRDGSLMISRRRTSVALRISRRTAAWQQAFCMHSSGTAAVV
jgi:hypothetical protein